MVKKFVCLVLILTIMAGASTTALATGFSNNPPSVGIIFDDDNTIMSMGWINIPSNMMNIELRCVPGCTRGFGNPSCHIPHSTLLNMTPVEIASGQQFADGLWWLRVRAAGGGHWGWVPTIYLL